MTQRSPVSLGLPPRTVTITLATSVMMNFVAGCASGKIRHASLTADPSVLVRQWTVPTHGPFEPGDRGIEFSNPIYTENTLFFGNRSTGLVALYPELGVKRWEVKIRGGVLSELALDQTSVYFGGGDGFLYSVSRDTGKVQWKYELRNPIVSRPTLSGDKLLITTSDDTVYAFEASNGKWLWHYKRRSGQAATILGASAPTVDGADVLVGMSDGYLVRLTLQDGTLKSQQKLHQGRKFTDVDAQPVLDGNTIYIASYDGALYALKRDSLEVLWKFDAGASKRVELDKDFVYLPSSDGTIYCLRKANGQVVWKFEMDDGTPTRLSLTDQYVLVGSSDRYFYALDRKSGRGLYRFDSGVESGFYGAPYFEATTGKTYILSRAGNLYQFALRQNAAKNTRHGSVDGYRQ